MHIVDDADVATEITAAVGRLVSVDFNDMDREAVECVLADARRVRGFVESVRLRAVARLEEIADATGNADPAASAGNASRTSRREGERVRKRAKAAAAAPALGNALAAGQISPEHLDALASALASLEPEQRAQLLALLPTVNSLATTLPADEFARALARLINGFDESDGLERLRRQRAATTLRWWRDPSSGMIRIFGEFDPERGLQLTQRLQRLTDVLFHETTPPDCPTDPERKQGHLRALALLDVVLRSGRGSTAGVAPTSPRAGAQASAPAQAADRVDIVIVVDLETMLHGMSASSRVEMPLDIQLPVETLRRLACSAGVLPAVLDGSGVVLDIGRRQHLATKDQRRAMRAMYRTCGLDPGCQVPFEHCELHHIEYWTRDHGPTDLINLVPGCNAHHHMVHEGGWRLQMRASDRRLTVIFPDGTVRHCWPDSSPTAVRHGTPTVVSRDGTIAWRESA